MMIWKYKAQRLCGQYRDCYGCPVTIRVPGVGTIQAVYQFQGAFEDQDCAVVDLPSGRIIAEVHDRHKGYPEQRAQAAIDEEMARFDDPWAAWHKAMDGLPVRNTLPSVVGVLR